MFQSNEITQVCTVIHRWDARFDGSTDPISFLERIDELKSCYQVSDEHVLIALPQLLEGKGLLWYRLHRGDWKTWDEFVVQFKKQYVPARYALHLEKEIQSRIQGHHETAADYSIAILTLMNRHGSFSKEDQLEILYENLRPEYKLFARRSQFKNLPELLSLAADFESIQGECNSFRSFLAPTYRYGSGTVREHVQIFQKKPVQNLPNDSVPIAYMGSMFASSVIPSESIRLAAATPVLEVPLPAESISPIPYSSSPTVEALLSKPEELMPAIPILDEGPVLSVVPAYVEASTPAENQEVVTPPVLVVSKKLDYSPPPKYPAKLSPIPGIPPRVVEKELTPTPGIPPKVVVKGMKPVTVQESRPTASLSLKLPPTFLFSPELPIYVKPPISPMEKLSSMSIRIPDQGPLSCYPPAESIPEIRQPRGNSYERSAKRPKPARKLYDPGYAPRKFSIVSPLIDRWVSQKLNRLMLQFCSSFSPGRKGEM